MKKSISCLFFLCLLMSIAPVFAQKTLPAFTIKELAKGKIQISWINPYNTTIQLSVQRSIDNKNFRTILSAQTPELYENGFVDNKSPVGINVYYRIYYVLKGGTYFFSDTQKTDNLFEQNGTATKIELLKVDTLISKKNIPKDTLYKFPSKKITPPHAPQKPKEYISVFKKDTLISKLELPDYKKFKDSINFKTKDTLYLINTGHVELHKYIPKYVWKPSTYVFSINKGNVTIQLPEVAKHRYRLVFFEENGMEIFQMKSIKESEIYLDKSDFLHAGWFLFELYEDEKLKEKSKFFLQKD